MGSQSASEGFDVATSMGTNVRAILYQHALSRAGLDQTPLRDAMTSLLPTEPELDDPNVFDPKVTGVWDHLLALMTDEQKTQLKEQAKKEGASPSYRHTGSAERQDKTGVSKVEGSATSTSDATHSRGPSRSHPVYLGNIAIAAHRANTFANFTSVMNVILPCSAQEAALSLQVLNGCIALLSVPPMRMSLAPFVSFIHSVGQTKTTVPLIR